MDETQFDQMFIAAPALLHNKIHGFIRNANRLSIDQIGSGLKLIDQMLVDSRELIREALADQENPLNEAQRNYLLSKLEDQAYVQPLQEIREMYERRKRYQEAVKDLTVPQLEHPFYPSYFSYCDERVVPTYSDSTPVSSDSETDHKVPTFGPRR